MHNYKLTIAYDGTNYHGWQIQPNGLTVQEVLQSKIEIIVREPVAVIGSGRTDAGVHARAQVANFRTTKDLDLRKFHHSINGLLPPDIRIIEVSQVPLDFHAQYMAKGKIYHYNIHLDRILPPFNCLYVTHFTHTIDLNLMREAAKQFVGTHDFTSFTNQSHMGCAAEDPVRTIRRLDIIDVPGGLRLEFEGDGFLYKMVRNITGTLLDIGTGNITLQELPSILGAKDRRKAGRTAPPEGLFLEKVFY